MDDWHSSVTTSAGNATGTTLVDTSLGRFGDNRLNGRYVRIMADTNVFHIAKITSNTQSTGTVTVSPAFSAQVATGVAFEIHKYDPSKKFLAMDKARLDLIDDVYRLVLDDTITSDGRSNVYDIPTAVEQGPMLAYFEEPVFVAEAQWNFLKTPRLDAATGWTSTNVTRTTVTISPTDLLIPKYDVACTRLAVAASTHGTYAQTVANMVAGTTAALAAGRKVTFSMWVYALEATRVTLQLTDDSATATGPVHHGRGWELLWVEKTISGTNTTTLTATLDIASGTNPMVVYANRTWLYFGDKERTCDSIYNLEKPISVRRDSSQQHVILGEIPTRGYQVRLQGKAPLSALGTDPLTQGSNLMEVDAKTAEVLYGHAASVLLDWERITTDNVPEVSARIAAVKSRMPALEQAWRQPAPSPHLRSPFGY